MATWIIICFATFIFIYPEAVQTTECPQNSTSATSITYTLNPTQDVWLENGGNKNYHNFLIVGKHPQFSKKRTLIQFEDLPVQCCKSIESAKCFLYFWYAHKASWQSPASAPYIPRPFQVHQLKKEWKENEATRYRAKIGSNWNKHYVAIDGNDACITPTDNTTIHTSQAGSYIELDFTEAMRNWINGEPNYGVLIWATNEDTDGRGFRFYSRERSYNKPYAQVTCAKELPSPPPSATPTEEIQPTPKEVQPSSKEEVETTPTEEVQPSDSPDCPQNSKSGTSIASIAYTLNATQDIYLSSPNDPKPDEFVAVGRSPMSTIKRIVIQFEDIPQQCCKSVESAKFFLYFSKAYKDSRQSPESAPLISRTVQVHQLKKEWKENEATRNQAKIGSNWTQPLAAIGGNDTVITPTDNITIHVSQVGSYIELDFTEAMQNWINGEPNYGVLIWATNEDTIGRDFHFNSRRHSHNRPYAQVTCANEPSPPP